MEGDILKFNIYLYLGPENEEIEIKVGEGIQRYYRDGIISNMVITFNKDAEGHLFKEGDKLHIVPVVK